MSKTLTSSSVKEGLQRNGASLLDKSIPFGFDFDSASKSRVNILADGLHFPLLVLKESALAYNLAAMAEWCAANKFQIAPHGKTTMTPRIFERQMEAGAWAITVATVSQAAICAEIGIKRVLIANQVVGRANLRSLAAMMKADPTLDVLCLVDSREGTEFLTSEWQAAGANRCLGVLVEMGRQGWRTGARSVESARELCAEVLRHPQTLRLRGIEGFEGLAHAPEPEEEARQVEQFLTTIAALGKEVQSLHRADKDPLLLSFGGSGFLDVVGEVGQQMRGDFQIVIRSGCYVTHDHGHYAHKLAAAQQRRAGGAPLPAFRPALELWSHVQSKPEEGLAILNFGKRDCSYDIGLPIPLFALNPNSGRRIDLNTATVFNTNDQHAHLRGPGSEHLRVGDQVCCGISHPCTAFDKWRALPVVDDSYNLLDIYRTYF
jgi:D-serine dehydratase